MSSRAEPGDYLARYAEIAPDFDRLVAMTEVPQPRTVWLNPIVPCPFDASARVLMREPAAVPLGYIENAWRLPPSASPGTWLEYAAGHFHAQEESTLWPGDLVGAQPGERVLDLCAAPGNKTLRIASMMGDRGVIVANEKNWQRLASLRFNLDRMGVTSVITNCADGCELDESFGLFDRVLVDVPCTCEGTGRKSGGTVRATTDRERKLMSDVQTGLLRSAFDYVRVGGEVVYATCTYAPEENEGVLSRLDPRISEIMPISPPPGLIVEPGLREWGGESFRPDAVNARRLWAHQNNTGGFFVARLRKIRAN